MSDYEITEQDIETTVKYLKIYHPENANQEFAREMLLYLKDAYRRISLTDPDELDTIYHLFAKTQNN